LGGRAPAGLLFTAVIAVILAAGFKLDAVASIGSAVALLVFTFISIGHLRVRSETGAQASPGTTFSQSGSVSFLAPAGLGG
jgi:hypothetical protein